jgi:hypothetical protein
MEYFLGNDEQNIGKMEQLIIIMISHSRYHFYPHQPEYAHIQIIDVYFF